MRIGVDIRPLQTGHKVRGIGTVTRNVTREIAQHKAPDDQLVVYMYENGEDVDLTQFGEDVIARYIPQPRFPRASKVFGFLYSAPYDIVRETSDVFIQFDFKMGLPTRHKNVLLIHDAIPVIFGDKYPFSYLSTYRTARRVGISRKHAITEKALRRYVYLRDMRRMMDRATEVLGVSGYTAKDAVQFASPERQKTLRVRPAILGFAQPKASESKLRLMEQARVNAMGLKKDNFLFFLGGVDDRRRIDELVSAFNYLRATGHDIKLVLAGHDFQPDMHAIFSPAARRAIEDSSYRDDICLLGFVSNRERQWLYDNAKAFVFPTEYEGFGLPILESLAEGCPVISYTNSSIPEVAGPNTLLVNGWEGIMEAVDTLDARSATEREQLAHQGREWTRKFTWEKTAKVFLKAAHAAVER